MLAGRADPQMLAKEAPVMPALDAAPLDLEDVETLQVQYEMSVEAAQDILPPALHPTVPTMVSWLVQRFPHSPWGPFSMAQLRIGCRSGPRPRCFLVQAAVDSQDAASALSSGWGYRVLVRRVQLRRFYDEIRAAVWSGEDAILELALRDPEPLGADYIQYVAGMHLAEMLSIRDIWMGPVLVTVVPSKAKSWRDDAGNALVRLGMTI